MKYLILVITSICIIGCDGPANKRNVKACIELGIEKKVAKKECGDFEGLKKKVIELVDKEIDKRDNLLQQAELINKEFDKYTKSQFKFNAEVIVELNSKSSNKLFSSKKVTNKPIYAHDAVLRDKLTSPHIFIDGKKWRINEENYEFLAPSFDGKYELRNDKTKNKSFTEFLEKCATKPRCKFSVIGTIDAIQPKIDESSAGVEWEGWIDVEDFSFNKFINTNPKREDIEDYVLREVYSDRNADYHLHRGYIKKTIDEYVYKTY